jgi:release factor glutamine methyltransferase
MSRTLVSLWTDVRRRLEAAGVETPVFDARLLLEAGAAVSRLDIVTDPRRPVTAAQVAAVEALTERREAREPVAHIVGHKHFWTLDLHVSPAVLVPRPETELVVETALEALSPTVSARVLDLGVGSGAILLAILFECERVTGVGVDISDAALAVAQRNAEALGLMDRVDLTRGDWDVALAGEFDLVISNPPYIPTEDIDALAPEVARFEPRLALDGGADGLNAYRAICARLPRLLRPGGAFALEVGVGQAVAVSALARAAGLSTEPPRRDLAGVPRVVWGRRAAST